MGVLHVFSVWILAKEAKAQVFGSLMKREQVLRRQNENICLHRFPGSFKSSPAWIKDTIRHC